MQYNFNGNRAEIRKWSLRAAAAAGAVVAIALIASLILPEKPEGEAPLNRQAQAQQGQPARPAPAPAAPAAQQPSRAATPVQAPQPPQPVIKNFEDWATLCERPQGATRDTCIVFQQMMNSTNSQRLLLTRVGQASAEGVSTVSFTLPLGVRLQTGIAVKVDENAQVPGAFQVCASDGCIVALPLDTALLQQFSTGKQAILAVIDHGNGQQLNFTLSLKGFANAYKSLSNLPPLAGARPAAAAQPAAAQPAPPANQRAPATNPRPATPQR